MKKITLAVLLSTFATAPAFAADEGFYAGATLGRASLNSPSANLTLTKSSDTVFGVLAGYQFAKNWGAEVFYTGAGKFSGNKVGGVTGSGSVDVFGASVVGTLPVSDAFSVYGKLGYASAKSKASSSNGIMAGATRSAATYGLGGVYNVSPAVGIRFGWDRYSAAAANVSALVSKDNFNINTYSLGAVFKF